MADDNTRFLQSIREEFVSQRAKVHYEILHQLLSGLLLRGMKGRGEGAHRDLIREAAEAHLLDPGEAAELDQLRVRRNNLVYNGESVPEGWFRVRATLFERMRARVRKRLAEELENTLGPHAKI